MAVQAQRGAFEGRCARNPKAKRGHGKQLVVGLAVNRDGFALADEILVATPAFTARSAP
jgi:hypothetical protein